MDFRNVVFKCVHFSRVYIRKLFKHSFLSLSIRLVKACLHIKLRFNKKYLCNESTTVCRISCSVI